MHFNSPAFLAFLAALLAAYHALQVRGRHRAQNALLLGASYVFYASFDWRFCGLLLATTLYNAWIGARIHATEEVRARRRWLVLAIALNLGVLGCFKYLDFFATNATALLRLFGAEMTWTTEKLVLPIGISFYTFQALSYPLDIYRRSARPVPLADFALFVSFFPQLVMGPIERAATLLPQIREPRTPSVERFLSGGWLLFFGLYKKIFVADQIAQHCDPMFTSPPELGGDVAVAAILFTIQIYADFSGYADIARGAARMFGFELMENFRAPLLARNVQQLWNRWHVSLTAFVRDYVFFPVALSRWGRPWGAAGAAFVAMTLVGLWHGADWTFVLWGIYHGVLLAVFLRLRPRLDAWFTFESRALARSWHCLSIAVTFSLFALSELVFRCGMQPRGDGSAIEQAMSMLHTLGTEPSVSAKALDTLWIALKIFAVVLVSDVCEHVTGRSDPFSRMPTAARRALQTWLLYCILQALANHETSLGTAFRYELF